MLEPYTRFTEEIVALHRRDLRADADVYRLLQQGRRPKGAMRRQLCLGIGKLLIAIGTKFQEPSRQTGHSSI